MNSLADFDDLEDIGKSPQELQKEADAEEGDEDSGEAPKKKQKKKSPQKQKKKGKKKPKVIPKSVDTKSLLKTPLAPALSPNRKCKNSPYGLFGEDVKQHNVSRPVSYHCPAGIGVDFKTGASTCEGQPARIEQDLAIVQANDLRIFLTPNTSDLEKAVAINNVVIEKRAKDKKAPPLYILGNFVEYNVLKSLVVVKGEPAQVFRGDKSFIGPEITCVLNKNGGISSCKGPGAIARCLSTGVQGRKR